MQQVSLRFTIIFNGKTVVKSQVTGTNSPVGYQPLSKGSLHAKRGFLCGTNQGNSIITDYICVNFT